MINKAKGCTQKVNRIKYVDIVSEREIDEDTRLTDREKRLIGDAFNRGWDDHKKYIKYMYG